ncbi:Trehalose synthase/amylase TreS [Baekduia alba]|uniref:alpha-amylase family glycosyl hydrolase n=1 Tax=Baekduia alba TaxID=2997333 RepID=UPI00234047B7|nr:alpha-amylase family glycosyl hydrolase [Baekduia alba]WCB91822.1 Trehalose synthase/amylase TreS [Baekduia alba]
MEGTPSLATRRLHLVQGAASLNTTSGAEPLPWAQTALIVQLPVYAIKDHDGRGTGTFLGMKEKLPFFADCGFNTIWLPPFMKSPGDDQGFDVSDFNEVDPDYGTLDDFRELVAEAHRLGLRVVIDVVPGHTSAEHYWFQQSRHDPHGPYGDFYVWHPEGNIYVSYRDEHGVKHEIRNILEVDPDPRMVRDRDGDLVAARNWTWDEVRREYYYHPFKASQPALNWDNPAVEDAMVDVFKFWVDLGVDGFRWDAEPFLLQEEGTPCEDLHAVHPVVRRVRIRVTCHRAGIIFLGEADVEDSHRYFGSPGALECDLKFDFDARTGQWMGQAIGSAQEFLRPVLDRPAIPPGCANVVFASCHDDVRAWRATDEKKAALRGYYGHGDRGRPYVDDAVVGGFSSMLDYDRRLMELNLAERMGLPGAKGEYYLNLTGTGHHRALVEAEDARPSLRTPMPWDGTSANGGFSTAHHELLYLPMPDGRDHFSQVNVADQLEDEKSWLRYVMAMYQMAARNPAVMAGSFELLDGPDNVQQWGCVRELDGTVLMFIYNRGREARRFIGELPTRLRRSLRGAQTVDLLSGHTVGELNRAKVDMPMPARGWWGFELKA